VLNGEDGFPVWHNTGQSNNTQIQFICTSEYIYLKYTTNLTPLQGVTNANIAYSKSMLKENKRNISWHMCHRLVDIQAKEREAHN
jgi:hypothetical protein